MEVKPLPTLQQAVHYDSIEVHGLAVIGEKVDISLRAEFFGVFVHHKHGGLVCVGKFCQYAAAASFAHMVHELFGYSVRDFCDLASLPVLAAA